MSQRITSTARHCRPFAECIVLTIVIEKLLNSGRGLADNTRDALRLVELSYYFRAL